MNGIHFVKGSVLFFVVVVIEVAQDNGVELTSFTLVNK